METNQPLCFLLELFQQIHILVKLEGQGHDRVSF